MKKFYNVQMIFSSGNGAAITIRAFNMIEAQAQIESDYLEFGLVEYTIKESK